MPQVMSVFKIQKHAFGTFIFGYKIELVFMTIHIPCEKIYASAM